MRGPAMMLAALLVAAPAPGQERPTMASVLEAASPADWRRPDPADTLYLELANGRVVFELARDFAPAHIANLRKLVRERYFDGLSIQRSQDNYVVQWGDPAAGTGDARAFGGAADSLAAEFERSADGLDFSPIDSRDAYADEVGFAGGFPAARQDGKAWLVHCYGTLGVGRATSPDSGSGAELYVVIGHAPRHLDRNVTLMGRVIDGIEHLSTLPRGNGPLGFYEDTSRYVRIESVRMGDELPAADRAGIELLRTDTPAFRALVEARRYRAEDWFVEPTGRVGVCNVPLPARRVD